MYSSRHSQRVPPKGPGTGGNPLASPNRCRPADDPDWVSHPTHPDGTEIRSSGLEACGVQNTPTRRKDTLPRNHPANLEPCSVEVVAGPAFIVRRLWRVSRGWIHGHASDDLSLSAGPVRWMGANLPPDRCKRSSSWLGMARAPPKEFSAPDYCTRERRCLCHLPLGRSTPEERGGRSLTLAIAGSFRNRERT